MSIVGVRAMRRRAGVLQELAATNRRMAQTRLTLAEQHEAEALDLRRRADRLEQTLLNNAGAQS